MRFGVLAIALSVALGGCGGGDADPLAAAMTIAADADNFDSGLESGVSLARIAEHLNEAIDACDPSIDGTKCAALGSASGFSQVLANRVLRCTAPGRFEAREAIVAYLQVVADTEPTAPKVESPPSLPVCG